MILGLILNKDVKSRGFKDEHIPENFEYIEKLVNVKTINIHEFAWRVKKWAFNLGYKVETNMTCSKLYSREYGSKPLDECHNTNWVDGRPYDPMCDILVCEWILENDDSFK